MSDTSERKSGLAAWVDRLIPPSFLKTDGAVADDRARRARILVVIVAASSAIGVTMSVVHFLDGHLPRSLFALSSVVPIAASLLILRWSGKIELATHYLCVLISLAVISSPFTSEESVPLMVGLIAVPLAAEAMGGARIGLIWTGIVGLSLLAGAIWLPFTPAERAVAWSLIPISTSCGVALAIMDQGRERATREALAARASAAENARGKQEILGALADSQAIFAAAFRWAPSMLTLSIAETGEILDVNESFVRIVGFERDEVIGRNLVDLGVWAGWDGRDDYVNRVGEVGLLHEVEVPLRTRDGELVWLLVSAERLEIAGRSCVLAQAIDISERKRIEQQTVRRREELETRFEERGERLKASQIRLRERERLAAVGTLAAGVAHQINNPIGGIIAASEFALSEDEGLYGDRARREALETALEEAKRCGRIVKSMLKFARNEPTPKWVEDINPIIRRACELARSYVEGRGGKLEITMPEEELPVLISPIDIEQVVLNLVHNAAESRPDGVRVSVATRWIEDKVEIVVADNGSGIDREVMSRIFDPFYTTRLEDGGSGLGLSVAHGVVADHGGSLDFESPEEGGARFRIVLPISEVGS